MEVILREDIVNLGSRGSVVKVTPGYARNFLLPKKMAVAATESNKKIVEQERQAHLKREAKESAANGRSFIISRKVALSQLPMGTAKPIFRRRKTNLGKSPENASRNNRLGPPRSNWAVESPAAIRTSS